jgi:uncharacterized protein (DUF1330 family)
VWRTRRRRLQLTQTVKSHLAHDLGYRLNFLYNAQDLKVIQRLLMGLQGTGDDRLYYFRRWTVRPRCVETILEKAFDTLIPYGGKVIARTSNVDVREAGHGPGWKPTRILIIEFPSIEAARSWYASPESQNILPIRLKASKDNMVIVEGLPRQ